MELVPWNPQWSDSGSKLDLHAYYKGKPGDDRYVRLPVRRHNDWARKGMTYVSLASTEDVAKVGQELRMAGVNLNELGKSYDNSAGGAFRINDYAGLQGQRDLDEAASLKARLASIESKVPTKGGK